MGQKESQLTLSTDHYLPFLKRVLTPKRLEHSLGVMQVMGELAPVYDLDREKALITGLLHDAAKDLDPTQQKEIIQQSQVQIQYECESDYSRYLHGPVGAYFVRQEFGITDPLILDAIAMHTFCGEGANWNAPICWCLRFADILEPHRNWSKVRWLRNGAARLKEAVYAGRLAEGAFLQTGLLIKWWTEDKVAIHPHITRSYQELARALNLDDSFLECLL